MAHEIHLKFEERLSDQVNVDMWEKRLGQAVRRTNEALVRMRRRERDLAETGERLNRFAAAKRAAEDFELTNLTGEYRFWRDEVVRLAAQIGAAYHLRAMRPQAPDASLVPEFVCMHCDQPIKRLDGKRWHHSGSSRAICANGRTVAQPC